MRNNLVEKTYEHDTLTPLVDGLAAHARKPAVLALHETGIDTCTYSELANYVEHLARGLVLAGVGRGEPVALFAASRPEWIIASLAVIRAGAAAMPVDAQLGGETLRHILADSGVRFAFATTEKAEAFDPRMGLTTHLLDAGSDDEQSWRKLLAEGPVELPQPGPEDQATLFYTSGTTGLPKGVPLSHANIASQMKAVLESGVITAVDRVALPLPLHHVYPYVIGMLAPLALGLTLILPQALKGPQIVRALREGDATVMVGVPRLYSAMYDGIQKRAESHGRLVALAFRATLGLSTWLRRRMGMHVGKRLFVLLHRPLAPRLRMLACGGAPLDPELAWKLEGLGWRLAIGYGLTETSPLLSMNLPGSAKLDTVGRPAAGVRLRIRGPCTTAEDTPPRRSATCSASSPGEILAKGPNVFKGYLHLPEQTRAAFTCDGWFRTGDLGYLDDDGFLHITGRLKHLIVTEGGENITPDEVEAVYNAQPVIKEFALLQQDGRLVALIVPDVGEFRRLALGEINAAVHEVVRKITKTLPSYQRISDYAITREPLPRTRLDKLQRHLLPGIYDRVKAGKAAPEIGYAGSMSAAEMSGEDQALLEHPVAQQVWEWLSRRYQDQRLTPDLSPQLDLGVDSLEWLNLTLEIQKLTGVILKDEAIARIDTLRDLLREIMEAPGTEAGTGQLSPLDTPEQVLGEQLQRWLKPRGPGLSAVFWVLYAVNRTVMRIVFRLQIKGLDRLPRHGQLLFAPNHLSLLDSFVLGAALDWRMMRSTYWAGWTGIAFANPVARLFSRLSQVVPVDPEQGVLSSLAWGAAVLDRGHSLVWFPEGRRSPDGKLQPLRPGIGILLEHFSVPVVPVSIQGTFEVLPMGKKWPRFKKITVEFGAPLEPRALDNEGVGDTISERIVNALHNQLAKLCRGSGGARLDLEQYM